MSYPLTLKIVAAKEMIDIQVQSNDTIHQIKCQVWAAWNVRPDRQVLHISSQRLVLHDDKTLVDYKIITDATIDFLVRDEDP